MLIIFDRRKGTLTARGFNSPFATGVWSGHGDAHNDPTKERIPKIGPIPAGFYRVGNPMGGSQLGPYVMSLTPLSGTNTYGRSGFFWHGDEAGDVNWKASEGCIISARDQRVNGNDILTRADTQAVDLYGTTRVLQVV